LATPITTTQLFLGKSIAAAAPAVVITWFCYVVFLIFARFFSVSERVFRLFIDPMWLVAMLLLVPLLTVLAVNVGIIISSRSTDPRAAEQMGALVVFPLIAFFLGVMAGFILLNMMTFLLTSAIVAAIDVGLVYAGVALFQRETILTRWK
jgi:ABC-2 type transport system permease protein